MVSHVEFTKTAIKALPVPASGKRATYYDVDIPKLALRVTSAGTRTFYIVKRVGAEMAWIKLGVFPDMTVENARKEAQKALGEFATGNNPAEAKRAYKGEATFQVVFDEYLKHKRKKNGSALAERTRAEYLNCARLHLGQVLPLKLSAVGHERIAQLHRRIGKEAPFMANRVKALVSAVFSYARDRRLFSGENPAAGVRGFAEEARDRFARAEELPHLFEAIAESPQRDYFLLSLLTGARRQNMQAMAWRDIDLPGAVWRIGKTKNGSPQNVTLSPEAVAVLAARKEGADGSPFVFPGPGKTGHLVEPKRAWATIVEHAGIENLRIHDLRRTLGSWQAMTGASLAIIGKSLNHKTQQATAIYARLDLDPVRQSVNTATAAIMEAAGVKDGAHVVKLPSKRSAA